MGLKQIASILVACVISIPAQAALYDIESPALGILFLMTVSDAIDPAVGGYDVLGITAHFRALATSSACTPIHRSRFLPMRTSVFQISWWHSITSFLVVPLTLTLSGLCFSSTAEYWVR